MTGFGAGEAAAGGDTAPVERLKAALEAAGWMGLTERQLAAKTGLPPATVPEGLSQLSLRAPLRRMGRGLWVLGKYAEDPSARTGIPGPDDYVSRFSRECSLLPEPYVGDIQFRGNEERPVHRWWPYVQGFSAGFVDRVLERFGAGPGTRVLDPFCGSGTVLVQARLRGCAAFGVERMPIAALAVRAKSHWEASPEDLGRWARDVVRLAREGPLAPAPFLSRLHDQFSREALDSLRRLKAQLWEVPEGPLRDLLTVAFASILVPSSQLKRAPCLGYARKPPVPGGRPFEEFLGTVGRIQEDLRWLASFRERWGPPPVLWAEDAREVKVPAGSMDLAITSPPYVNGMDYVMNYKLELTWLDMTRSYEELSRLKESMVTCDNVSRRAVAEHRPAPDVAEEPWIRDVVAALRESLRGKEGYRRRDMAELVRRYFDDMYAVLGRVHEALRPGGHFVVVNGDSLMAGVYIPSDLLLARLARLRGFRVVRFEPARSRRSGQRRTFRLRESILTLRKEAGG